MYGSNLILINFIPALQLLGGSLDGIQLTLGDMTYLNIRIHKLACPGPTWVNDVPIRFSLLIATAAGIIIAKTVYHLIPDWRKGTDQKAFR